VAHWIVRHLRYNREAELLVEFRSLKTVRSENDLAAFAPDCLRLGFCEQPSTDASPAERLGYPYLAQLAGFTPRMTGGSSDDAVPSIAKKYAETSAVRDSGCVLIELVESIFEVVDVCEARLLVLKALIGQCRPPVVSSNGSTISRVG
jgi:hypothetical protein